MKKGPRAQRSALKVRVRAKNGVGWSSADAQISCRTAERPLKSRQLQCVEAGSLSKELGAVFAQYCLQLAI